MGIFSHASDYISISKAEWEGKKTPMCWENFEMSRSTKTAPQIFISFNTYLKKKFQKIYQFINKNMKEAQSKVKQKKKRTGNHTKKRNILKGSRVWFGLFLNFALSPICPSQAILTNIPNSESYQCPQICRETNVMDLLIFFYFLLLLEIATRKAGDMGEVNYGADSNESKSSRTTH